MSTRAGRPAEGKPGGGAGYPEAAYSAADRYRRATFALAVAAREVAAATAELDGSAGKVSPAAGEDLEAAIAVLSELPEVKTVGGVRRPKPHVTGAKAGPKVRRR